MNRKITLLLLILALNNAFAQDLVFSNKADKLIARAGAASAKDLAGNNMYVANGFDANGLNTIEIEKYNFADNTWALFPTSVPTIGKRYGNMEVISNKLYIFNGLMADGGNSDKLEIINLNNGTLTVNSTLNPNPVYGAGSSVLGDYLVTFGGCIDRFSGNYSNKLYRITPYGSWTQLADMPVGLETKGEVVYDNTNSKLYVFGGYRELTPLAENFGTVTSGDPITLTDWVSLTETGTKNFEGATYGGNSYAQITAYTGVPANQEPSNIAWLISKPLTASAANQTILNFNTNDGYDNGAVLQAYLITNWTGDIFSSTKTLLDANIAGGTTSGYGNFVNSGDVVLPGDLTEFRIGFKYTGGFSPLATTTFQVDNVRVYQPVVSNNIYIYDVNDDSWTTSATMLPLSLSAYAIASENMFSTKLYITGDYYNQTFTGVYDTTSDSFTSLTNANMIGRRHHNSEIWNNKLYITGGNTESAVASVLSGTQSADISVLGTGDVVSQSEVKVYPNPAADRLDFSAEVRNVSVFTIDGKVISVSLVDNAINVSTLPAGVYLLKGEDANGTVFRQKLIKK